MNDDTSTRNTVGHLIAHAMSDGDCIGDEILNALQGKTPNEVWNLLVDLAIVGEHSIRTIAGVPPGEPVYVVDPDTEAEPGQRFACRFLNAYMNDDEPTAEALFRTLHDADEEQRILGVVYMVHAVAMYALKCFRTENST